MIKNNKNSLVEIYKGFEINSYNYYHKYFGKLTNYVCNINSTESCKSTNLQILKKWIDKKIKKDKNFKNI